MSGRLPVIGHLPNSVIRAEEQRLDPRPKVVIDIAHVGRGFQVGQGMRKLAELGLPSVCSVHTQSEYAMKYC